jgi:hypothetical protein
LFVYKFFFFHQKIVKADYFSAKSGENRQIFLPKSDQNRLFFSGAKIANLFRQKLVKIAKISDHSIGPWDRCHDPNSLIFAKELAFFSKNNVVISSMQKLDVIRAKKANIFHTNVLAKIFLKS